MGPKLACLNTDYHLKLFTIIIIHHGTSVINRSNVFSNDGLWSINIFALATVALELTWEVNFRKEAYQNDSFPESNIGQSLWNKCKGHHLVGCRIAQVYQTDIPCLVWGTNTTGHLTTLPQCNIWPKFSEILCQILIVHHWLSMAGNSAAMHCG